MTQQELATYDLSVIRKMQTEHGTVMAGPTARHSDPYDRIWIRDNALVALSLEMADEHALAIQITEGLLRIMEQYKSKIESIIEHGKPDADEENHRLIHPVYHVSTEELGVKWGWRQNDAIGNLLQAAGKLKLITAHQEIIQLLVKYLEVVEYWEKDNGIWEWTQHVQVNTILGCVAGLRAVAPYIEVSDELIQRGYQKTATIQGHSDERYFDLAHLNPFMLGELSDPKIIEDIEHELLREYGVIRYHGDHYMSGGDGKEARWVLGLLMLGHAWLACSQNEKAKYYLDWADRLRVGGGDLPEAYIYEDGKYVPCEHTPLVWCHALALSLRYKLNSAN